MSKNKKRGFTFLETIVAIGILTIALASPLTLASSSIRAAGQAKDKFIASYLAAEAIEYVRNVRDTNALTGGWLGPLLSRGVKSCRTEDGGCIIDVTQSETGAAVTNCGSKCLKIKYDETSGLYQYNSGSDTKFIRTVKINELVKDQEAEITVTVSWDGGGSSLIIQDNIFNWRLK